MTISDLAKNLWESPNRSIRELPVDRITVHHVAGKLTATAILAIFADPARKASSNYVIGYDGEIGCSVPEEYRAWTSGNWSNDQQAINIEVSNDVNGEPWSVSEASWNSLITLCADICIRYGFRMEFSPDPPYKTLTAHRFFQATGCPGDWLYSRFPKLCDEVNNMIDIITNLQKRVSDLEGTVKDLTSSDEKQNKKIDKNAKNITKLQTAVESISTDMHKLKIRTDLIDDTVGQHQIQIGIVADEVKDVPKWAKPTIEKMVNKGILAGTGTGLELNRILMRVFVILDRLGCI